MTSLPNPFNSGAIQASPDEAAVPFRPQVPEGTAADLSSGEANENLQGLWSAPFSGSVSVRQEGSQRRSESGLQVLCCSQTEGHLGQFSETTRPGEAASQMAGEQCPSAREASETTTMSSLPNAYEKQGSGWASSGLFETSRCDVAVSDLPSSREFGLTADANENHIGEIFVGAARLEPIEIWFENSAYPVVDELLFEVLEAMADRSLPGIAQIPDEAAFMIEIGPLPLFLQNAEAAA